MANRYATKDYNETQAVPATGTKCHWNWPHISVPSCDMTAYHALAWGVIDNVNQQYHLCFKQLQVPLQGAD